MAAEARTPSEAALQVLIAESAQFNQTFRWNEETGERRVTIILTLMTVAAAAAGVIADSVDITVEAKLRLLSWVAVTLFILGLVTLARLVRRNVATDEYQFALDRIREKLISLVGEDLKDYWPLPKSGRKPKPEKWRVKRYLGLTLLMATTNAILLAAAGVLGFSPPRPWSAVIGTLVFVVALAAQMWLAKRLEARLRVEVGLPRKKE
jgi:hypothetical protein